MEALDEMARILAPGGRLVLQATCHKKKKTPPGPKGLRIFAHDELPTALADRGLVDVQQLDAARAQFVSARKPAA
ncbi:MAG TPA: hypothetical protein VFT10_07415, partial [Solirubrobacterales bacterium]|nr:hypothetical protein [Solirubrobacterales bacterium]